MVGVEFDNSKERVTYSRSRNRIAVVVVVVAEVLNVKVSRIARTDWIFIRTNQYKTMQ